MNIQLKNKINENDLEIRISIGEDCNMSCNYCPADYSKNKFTKINELIDLIKRSKFNNLVLTFSGGEPLIYLEEIDNILTKIKSIYSKKLDVKILTNGVKLSEYKVRGRIRLFNLLYNLELIISIHNTLSSLNKQLAWLTQSKINYYTRKPITTSMNDSIENSIKNNTNENIIDDLFPAYGNFEGIKILGNKNQFLMDGKSSTLNDIYEMTNFNFENYICDSGKDLICINTDGKVYPCSMYLHNKFGGVDIEDFTQKETKCELKECWCFTSCKRKNK